MSTPRRPRPTPPIDFAGARPVRPHLQAPWVEVHDRLAERLVATGADVTRAAAEVAEASRDWWPLAMTWALADEVGALAGALVRVTEVQQVAGVLAACHEARVPVTTVAGRSGVCGASVPLHGGVALDVTGLAGITGVDEAAQVVDVAAGTFGDVYEDTLRAEHGLTGGHWPQSIALSTVGGWLACRSAGQLSTRYGKIEDLVVGLDVVLADGRRITTGGSPRAAVGPDLTQVFVGSEGTLGVITGARLRAHPLPPASDRAAYGFTSFAAGLDAMRRVLQRGATPAVLRLYDADEAARSYGTDGVHVLLAFDEGDPVIVEATARVVADACAGADRLDDALVDRWFEHRNDVAALEALVRRGYVVDTMEVAAPWSRLPSIYEAATAAIRSVEGTLVCTAHQSHSYTDGGCLYFTFAGQPEAGAQDAYYVAAWDAGTRAVLAHGGALSHHHGVGLNRARFVRGALGGAFDVLVALKAALDPAGILNPGKLGLPSPFGDAGWP
jgi:alkyldihydroxyacetonephosphate synthase